MFSAYALTFSHWDNSNGQRLRVFRPVKITVTQHSVNMHTIWEFVPPEFKENKLYVIRSGGENYVVVNYKGTVREATLDEIHTYEPI